MPSPKYDPNYVEGVRCFNSRAFFDAHEAWERLWIDYEGPSRLFYKGLIQVAVCLHHFGNGNTRGARKLYHMSSGYLDAYRPRYEGIDVDRLLTDLKECCAEVVASEEFRPTVKIDPELIPVIQLDPPVNAE